MNFTFNRICGRLMAMGIVAAALVFLTACSDDILTWSKDAQQEGLQDYKDGRYAEAAGAFRNAIRQNPSDPISEYWLALSYEQSQSYHEAIDAFKTCLRLMPPPGTVYYNSTMHDTAFDRLARIIARNDYTGSEIDLVQNTAKQDESSEEYRLLGRIFRYRGDADSGLDNYRRAVQIDPSNFVAQRELGLYLEQLSQNQEAGQVLRDAYRLNQNDSIVNIALRRIGIEPGPSLLAQQRPANEVLPALPADSGDPGISIPAASTNGPASDPPAPRD
jgi:tetratricopeptide (TPR) repeat protein